MPAKTSIIFSNNFQNQSQSVLTASSIFTTTTNAGSTVATQSWVQSQCAIQILPSGDTTGATDVSNINSAISALGSTGGVVNLAAGAYYINSPIVMQNRTQLKGTGLRSTIIYAASGANCNMITNHVSSNGTSDPNAKYIIISDLCLDGSASSQSANILISTISAASPAIVTTASAHGLSTGQQVYISDNSYSNANNNNNYFWFYASVTSPTTFAIYGNSSSPNLSFSSASAYPYNTSASGTGGRLNVVGNGITFMSNPQNTSGLADDNNKFPDSHNTVKNVIIENMSANGVFTYGNGEMRFENVSTLQCQGHGFYVAGADGFYQNCTAGNNSRYGFYILGVSNRFTNCKSFGSGYYPTTPSFPNATSQNHGWFFNQLTNGNTLLSSCEAQDNFGAGFLIQNSSRVSLMGCSADSNTRASSGAYPGLDIYSSQNCIIKGFVSQERNANGSNQLNGVRIRNGSVANRIEFNHLAGTTSASIGTPLRSDSNTFGNDVVIGGMNGLQNLAWSSATYYSAGQIVYAASNTYMATVAGTSGNSAPTWPGSGTVTDSGVTWAFISNNLTINPYLGNTVSFSLTGNLIINAPSIVNPNIPGYVAAFNPHAGCQLVLNLIQPVSSSYTVTLNSLLKTTGSTSYSMPIASASSVQSCLRFIYDGSAWESLGFN